MAILFREDTIDYLQDFPCHTLAVLLMCRNDCLFLGLFAPELDSFVHTMLIACLMDIHLPTSDHHGLLAHVSDPLSSESFSVKLLRSFLCAEVMMFAQSLFSQE